MRLGYLITSAKVWAAAKLLQLMGRSRQARAVENGFKAFCVQNTPQYARSIVSKVANARELWRSILPEERADWACVWEARDCLEAYGDCWDTYGATGFAGLRTLVLKLPASEITGVKHGFEPKQGLSDPSLMATWMAAAATTDRAGAANASPASCTTAVPPASTTSACSHRSDGGSSSDGGYGECMVTLSDNSSGRSDKKSL